MADQVMTVDGNFRPYIEGARKAEEATKKVGKATASIGDQFSSALVKVDLLKQGLLKAFQLIDKANALNVDASKSRDERNIAIATSSASLKTDAYKVAGIIENRSGAGSRDAGEDVNFLSSLASASKSRPVPISEEEVLKAVALYHKIGDVGTGKGGGDLTDLISKGYSVDQSAKMLGRRNAFAPALDAIGRGNAESGAQINSENARSAAGAESRAFTNFAQDRANKGGVVAQLYEMVMPDLLEKMVYDFNQAGAKKLGLNFGKNGYRDSVDQTAQSIDLGGAIQSLTNSIGASVTKPNGAVEVK